jgi:hypothetical protein
MSENTKPLANTTKFLPGATTSTVLELIGLDLHFNNNRLADLIIDLRIIYTKLSGSNLGDDFSGDDSAESKVQNSNGLTNSLRNDIEIYKKLNYGLEEIISELGSQI